MIETGGVGGVGAVLVRSVAGPFVRQFVRGGKQDLSRGQGMVAVPTRACITASPCRVLAAPVALAHPHYAQRTDALHDANPCQLPKIPHSVAKALQ